MDNTSTYLVHSSKGTTWTKKDHKYIVKIGNKYYYDTLDNLNDVANDIEKASKLKESSKSTKTASKKTKEAYKQSRKNAAKYAWEGDRKKAKEESQRAKQYKKSYKQLSDTSENQRKKAKDLVKKHSNSTVKAFVASKFKRKKYYY